MKSFKFKHTKALLTITLKILFLPILLIALISLGLFIWTKSSNLSDFGLNFTTEIIGVFITVFIVDYLIKKRENNRLIPIRIIAYQESSLIYNRFLGLIFELYNRTIKEDPPDNTIDFLKSDSITKALCYADCNANAKTSPPQKLTTYVANCGIDLSDRAEKLIDKYSIYLDPKLASLIHKCFIESPFIGSLKLLSTSFSTCPNKPKPLTLISYVCKIRDEDIFNLVELFKLLLKESIEYQKIDSSLRLLANPKYILDQKDRELTYKISNDKLLEIIKESEEEINNN